MTTKITKTRKKPKVLPDLTKEDLPTKLKAINMYVNGTAIDVIASELGWSEKSIWRSVQAHFVSLKDVMETENLIKQQAADDNLLVRTPEKVRLYRNQGVIDKNINKFFVEKLSGPEENVLTQEESLFCYLMVHEGDEKSALEDSGLAEGLTKSGRGYKRAIRLRCLMLKGKKNIVRYINGLQIDYAKEMNVNKEMIQSELISQIRQLRELNDSKLAPTIAKLTESLGRTIGAFVERVEVSELSFDDAMDTMIEMRRKRAKDSGDTESDGVYVYDPDKIV